MIERPERAIKWLEEKYESGPAQVTGVIQYILKLEAELAEAKAKSERLDKVERLLKKGLVLSANHWDPKRDEWADVAVQYEGEEDVFDSAVEGTLCEAIDKLEEQPHECKEHAIPVEGRGWVCEKCGYHITGD